MRNNVAQMRTSFQKDDRSTVENYRPKSILLNISKDYKRCIYDKIYQYFNKIPSKQQYQLQQCFCMQICLLVIIEKRRKCLGIDGVNGTLLKDQ